MRVANPIRPDVFKLKRSFIDGWKKEIVGGIVVRITTFRQVKRRRLFGSNRQRAKKCLRVLDVDEVRLGNLKKGLFDQYRYEMTISILDERSLCPRNQLGFDAKGIEESRPHQLHFVIASGGRDMLP